MEVRTFRQIIDTEVTFTNNETKEQLIRKITRLTWYPNIRTLLEKEGITNVLSSGLDLENGIKSIESFPGYKKSIESYGVLALIVNHSSSFSK